MIRYVIISLLGAFLISCEQVVDIDIAGDPPVVVNALFNPDSTWRIRVDKAWGISEPRYYTDTVYDESGVYHLWTKMRSNAIEDALIEIIPGSSSGVMFAYDSNGYYISQEKPRAGESYILTVKVPDHPVISSSVILPEPVPLDTAYITEDSFHDLLLTIEFTDVPGPTTYEISAWSDVYQKPILQCDDPDVHTETYWTPLRQGYEDYSAGMGPVFLSIGDWNFQGQKKRLVIRLNADPVGAWTVRMRTLSDEYAQYRATSLLQQNTHEDPFAEPVQVFNNISNGVGIFAGYSVVDYHFNIH
jgi:hypothetical protein